jgi:predicted Zn-dependent protease
MKSLDISDLHVLRAVEGWIELGNFTEAEGELNTLSPEKRAHPDVLDFRFQIHAGQKNWDVCREIAQTLTKREPARSSGWLHLAYATRRATGGSIQAAWDILLPTAECFPKNPTIHYNLACYACQMGRLDEARQWLESALTIGDAKSIKRMALVDSDLEPLHKDIPGM